MPLNYKNNQSARIDLVIIQIVMNYISSGTIYHNGLFICCPYVALTKGMEYHIPGSSLKNFATGKITWLVSSVTMMFRGYSLDGQPHLLSVASSPAHLCSVMKYQGNFLLSWCSGSAKGRKAEHHTHKRKKRKPMHGYSHGFRFRLLVDAHAYARRLMGLTETCSLVEHLWFGHPCYDQLTPVKIRIRWPI